LAVYFFFLPATALLKKTFVRIKADADHAGLTLPVGFGALKAADEIGPARHLA